MKWIIDAGHGGMLWDCYLTRGKRSPGKKTRADFGVFEGDFNRAIARMIMVVNKRDNLRVIPGICDASLRERINAINQVYARYGPDVALISVHANASRWAKWTPASGFRVFHARVASGRAKHLARLIDASLSADITTIPRREILSRNWAILKKTKCPAVLIECGFMTSEADVTQLANVDFRHQYARAIVAAMATYEGLK